MSLTTNMDCAIFSYRLKPVDLWSTKEPEFVEKFSPAGSLRARLFPQYTPPPPPTPFFGLGLMSVSQGRTFDFEDHLADLEQPFIQTAAKTFGQFDVLFLSSKRAMLASRRITFPATNLGPTSV